ncbi:DUF4328 domain-containing protein [Streptomyces sp. BR1]|uniref:DUF4328 domain-containing protein n=1 Tax=Streptomyces sp. BR1 TaxID=1592323 RepID=UPI00402BB278
MLPQPGVLPPPTTVLRSPHQLATATSILLAVVATIDVFALYAGITMHNVTGDLLTRSSDEIDRADDLYTAAGYLQLFAMLATAIVFITWFHRVRCNADAFAADVCTRSRGWAVGGWLIPVGNLWIPFTIAREVWTASTQRAPDGSWREMSQRPIKLWWTMWLAALAMNRFASTMYQHADTPDSLQRAADVTMLADVLDLAAALLAIAFVRKLTAMQHTKATQGPAATA